MKRNLFFLIISFLFCLSTYGQSFKQDFLTALEAKKMEKAEEILKAWDFDDSNDPELYIAYFNFYTVKSQNAVGSSIISAAKFDKTFSRKALDFITEGIERFPTRFDMRIAKIYMLGELKDFTLYTNEIVKLIEQSKIIDNNWKSENFRLLDRPVEIFYGSVQDFQEKLFTENNAALYKDIIRISNEIIKINPKHTQSYLNISTIYITQKEYDKSLDALKKALDLDSKNSVILYNMAYVYNIKGDKGNAKKHFELTVANTKDNEESLKEAAQKQLNALQ